MTEWLRDLPLRPRKPFTYFLQTFADEYRASGGDMKQLMKAGGDVWKTLDNKHREVRFSKDPEPLHSSYLILLHQISIIFPDLTWFFAGIL